ncbi:pimeloyl-ACP methyl ester carboxylesterase [Microbacterium terrae]|uniref:Alpha/beta hydrolase family protein n=1 Tax=Microbacterium terrae TaxID=69369 RepID=A0A0M2H280_9MICO|nr:hypothetical protein [Microbacterium terrae]KJL38347.1 Alpha/beta hydrolase family protein [Microbacterium terrae]MBP1079012.1 pimeloyl-ACP methyl ester carboxylesterase [Microbacterium terrae]GLJ98412.1 hypothetical protein GCM10017594_16090 [Microbacterium terrae]
MTAEPTGLIVLVPGLGRTKIESLEKQLIAAYPNHRVKTFQHGIKPLSTRRGLDAVVDRLANSIRAWAGDNDGRREETASVILVGHSIGGIIARAAFLEAAGFGSEAPDDEPNGWATKTVRIVLLGSPNSGYHVENFPRSWRWAVPIVSGFAAFTIESVASGAYWLADLRLRWLHGIRVLGTTEAPKGSGPRPLIVQAYGDDDELVTRDDIDDSEYMPGTVRTRISSTDHGGLVDLTDASTKDQRWSELRHVIFGTFHGADTFTPPVETPVHFLLHGIRASAYDGWIGGVAAALRSQSTDAGSPPPKVVSLNYRFFSAIEFALPFTRRRNVHQFLDTYMAAVLTHSPDQFTFMGHSNGTYMMATVMKHVRAVRFRRILLAGTVLPPGFDWAKLRGRRQIGAYDANGVWADGEVHNDCARFDVPVGILATAIAGLGFRDIGAAGLRGFEGSHALDVTSHPTVFPQGHGGALQDHDGYPSRMPEIARFLSTGTVCTDPHEQRSRGFGIASRVTQILAPLVVLGILVGLGFAFAGLVVSIGVWGAIAAFAVPLVLIYVGLRTV